MFYVISECYRSLVERACFGSKKSPQVRILPFRPNFYVKYCSSKPEQGTWAWGSCIIPRCPSGETANTESLEVSAERLAGSTPVSDTKFRKSKGVAKPNTRKVIRPNKDILLKELSESNYTQMGKKYGVSDNAIRKWLK